MDHHRSVDLIQIYPLCQSDSFILYCISFSLTGEWKGEKSLKRYWWIVIVYTYYYIMLIAKCTCTWLHHQLKLTSTMFLPCTHSSQPGWFHVETYGISNSVAILLLDSRNSSLFSRQLTVRVCRKSAKVEPSVELQITSLEYRFTRLARGLEWVTGQFSLQSSSAE